MSSMIVHGVPELVKELERLGGEVRDRVVPRAITRGAKILETAAAAAAPSKYGWLKRSMITVTRKYRGGEVFVGVVGPSNQLVVLTVDASGLVMLDKKGKPRKIRPSKYAHLVESGTKAHAITIHFKDGRSVTLQHPGTRGTWFMRRAFEATKSEVQSVIENTLREYLSRAG